jgi:SPP1 family predicted phage head-tail adaptor
MIGELNRRITIKTSTYDQDAGGGISADETGSHIFWAKVEERNGFPISGNEQQVWNYDYRITVRYEKSRVIKSNQTIDFDGKTLSVNSVSFEKEGKRWYTILRCATTDNNIYDNNTS